MCYGVRTNPLPLRSEYESNNPSYHKLNDVDTEFIRPVLDPILAFPTTTGIARERSVDDEFDVILEGRSQPTGDSICHLDMRSSANFRSGLTHSAASALRLPPIRTILAGGLQRSGSEEDRVRGCVRRYFSG